MAFSFQEYTADGILSKFNYGFEFINEIDIFVSLGGVLQIKDTDYTMGEDGSNFIQFTVTPALDLAILIQRNTPIVDLESVFTNTAILDADQLNAVNLQQLYKLQETSDALDNNINSFAGNNTMNQNLDMNINQIISLGDGVNDGDAINFKQANDILASIPTQVIVVDGEGYEIGQTALSSLDLETLIGFEFTSRAVEVDLVKADYLVFNTATNGVYDIGGGILRIPDLATPDVNQLYYTRLK